MYFVRSNRITYKRVSEGYFCDMTRPRPTPETAAAPARAVCGILIFVFDNDVSAHESELSPRLERFWTTLYTNHKTQILCLTPLTHCVMSVQ